MTKKKDNVDDFKNYYKPQHRKKKKDSLKCVMLGIERFGVILAFLFNFLLFGILFMMAHELAFDNWIANMLCIIQILNILLSENHLEKLWSNKQ